MKKFKQFLEKLEWIILGLAIDIIFMFFDVFHKEHRGDSIFTLFLNGNYSLIFKDIFYIMNLLVVVIITFYIIRAIPKLFIYEEDYDIKDGLGYFFKYRERYYKGKLSTYASILAVIMLTIYFLYIKYKYGI